MAGVAGKSGGARKNAGRNRKQQNNEGAVIRAERRCADRLPVNIANLENLADGSAEPEVEEEWLPAGFFTVEEIEMDGEGKAIKTKRLVYPDKPADELVLVKKKTKTYGPDVRANMYLTDRAMGKPASGDEIKIQELVNAELNAFVEKIRSHFEPGTASAILEALANANTSNGGALSDGPNSG